MNYGPNNCLIQVSIRLSNGLRRQRKISKDPLYKLKSIAYSFVTN